MSATFARIKAPKYAHHKRSNRARVITRDHLGRRKEVWLPGLYDSLESRRAYERLLAELQAHGGRLAPPRGHGSLTVAELVLDFTRRKVEVDYVDADGEPTGEQKCQRQALAPLERMFGPTLAAEFDSIALKAVQRAMASGSWLTSEEAEKRRENGYRVDWCRSLVNRNISRIRSFFKWCVGEKLVPPVVLLELQAVAPLKIGRGARETELVLPVDPVIVEATLPKLPPHIRDMVLVQLRTGMRPGELCDMRAAEIDQSAPVWVYRPRTHKTAHHGHARTIPIGPKAQAVLARHLEGLQPEDFIFSPARQLAEMNAAKRAARKSKVQPSQEDRSKGNAKRRPKDRFRPRPYSKAVARACKAAGVEHWHPNRLRHTAALLIEREQGAEAARAVLGHKTLNMTLHYSGIDLRRAVETAARMG